MVEHNYEFMIYIGTENNDFNDLIIIKTLNNKLITCRKIDSANPSCNNFNYIFSSFINPSIYLLERNIIKRNITKE